MSFTGWFQKQEKWADDCKKQALKRKINPLYEGGLSESQQSLTTQPAPVSPAPVRLAPASPAPVSPAPVRLAPASPAPVRLAPASPASIFIARFIRGSSRVRSEAKAEDEAKAEVIKAINAVRKKEKEEQACIKTLRYSFEILTQDDDRQITYEKFCKELKTKQGGDEVRSTVSDKQFYGLSSTIAECVKINKESGLDPSDKVSLPAIYIFLEYVNTIVQGISDSGSYELFCTELKFRQDDGELNSTVSQKQYGHLLCNHGSYKKALSRLKGLSEPAQETRDSVPSPISVTEF